MSGHHYFGSTAFTWATGKTRAEVMRKLATGAGQSIMKANVKANGGLYAWTVRVNVPESADYAIEYYQPKGVPLEKPMEFLLQNAKGYALPYEKD